MVASREPGRREGVFQVLRMTDVGSEAVEAKGSVVSLGELAMVFAGLDGAFVSRVWMI